MNWQDSGFLISKNKYSENSAIVEFYILKPSTGNKFNLKNVKGQKLAPNILSTLGVYFVGGIILLVMPIVMVWGGGLLLKDVLIDKQPHDRDLFAKVFMIISGIFATFVAPVFLVYYTWFN